MALVFTLDASVFVAACRADEPGYPASRSLLSEIRKGGIPLMEPAILPVETAAALRRAGLSAADALDYALSVTELPRLILLPIDTPLAIQSAQIAVDQSMRGADAIYATVADLYGTVLVTLDREQLQRGPKSVKACTPEAARRLL
jgi:predicted nucleic acid-binding protein